MSKAIFQSGMSWKVVENKWAGIQVAFYDFDIQQVANLNEPEIEALAQDKRVIRNYRKLSAIVHNARRILELADAHGSFQAYLRAHGDFDATLKAMRKDFKFIGPTSCYYFLYVVGEAVPPHEEFEATYRS
ncbi:MAG: DNA-3-methyladenine glycosylase I [Candidatus Promineifilaceae bacterium]|nr:DNA-3-methyladenine glycosylase I [Candidatus Promineifilaceae bacterium]